MKWLSRQYEPGYIEAFRQDYSTDWAAYVAEAQEQLAQAIESSRRSRDVGAGSHPTDRDREQVRAGDRAVQLAPSSRTATGTAASASAVASRVLAPHQLKIFLTRSHLPDEGMDRFVEILKDAVDELGPDDSDLLHLVHPYSQYIAGNDLLGSLRHSLEQYASEQRRRASGGRAARGIVSPGDLSPVVDSPKLWRIEAGRRS